MRLQLIAMRSGSGSTSGKIADFVARHGTDAKAFLQTLDSFSVATQAKQASGLASGYTIEGTPSIGIDGRWLTSGSTVGSNERSLAFPSTCSARRESHDRCRGNVRPPARKG